MPEHCLSPQHTEASLSSSKRGVDGVLDTGDGDSVRTLDKDGAEGMVLEKIGSKIDAAELLCLAF